jgi:hypothetical protein
MLIFDAWGRRSDFQVRNYSPLDCGRLALMSRCSNLWKYEVDRLGHK